MSNTVHLQPRRSLTPAQELIWTSQRLQPDSPHQNMALITRFTGSIDPERFLESVDAVVAKSDALRTIIQELDGVPHPTISSANPSPCKVIRIDHAALDGWMRDRISTPIDLSSAAFESVLIDLGTGDGDEDYRWAWWVNVHHIVIDAASSANFFNAVAAHYSGSPDELVGYAEVWSELAAQQQSARYQKALDTWALVPDAAPTRFYRSDAGPTSAAERISIDMASGRQEALDALLSDRFKMLSPDLSLTVALATALSAYTARLGNDSVTIGVPIHHRSTKNAKRVIGPLVELFPLRVEVASDDTFASLHKRVGRSFFQLLSAALPGTSPRQDFDLVLNVHGATLGDFGDIPASTTWVHPGHIDPHHRLRIQALDYDGSGVLELAMDINHRIADGDHRRRAASHFGAVLDSMVDNPDQRIHEVGLVGLDERLLLESFAAPGSGTPIDGVAPDIVAARLRAHSDRPTLQHVSGTAERIQLTAAEVDQRIDMIAGLLRRAGFGAGDLVGIEMPIGIDAVVAIHGVQRAGAAFVPIDPAYPSARREHIRSDSGCRLVIRDLDELALLPVVNEHAEPSVIGPDDLAYVIYTSGSTGLPKGVPITHRGLSEYLGFAYSAYVGPTSPTMPLFTSLSFDLTITTLFLPLLSGGLMTVHPEGGLPALREIVEQKQATLLKATPSHLELLVRMIGPDHPLTGLIVGGEAFMTDLADRLIDVLGPDLTIINEYGPTEAVVGCMKHLYNPSLDHGPEVPIGQPAPGVGLLILDSYGHPVPLGVSGELYISRAGMTAGYLGRDDLNAAKLVRVPQSGFDGLLYRTGDLVRMLDADRMVYLGRIDEQIKVGGIRLEPGEIEHVAQGVSGVVRAVAGLWSPDPDQRIENCVRCGLGSDVPDIVIDGDGVCSSCHHFELVAPQAEAWFKDESDLVAALADARARSTGDYDVVHLISGGKDSTYALYKLVELGARVFAITLDNGYIAEVAKANVRRATASLGVDHEFVTVEGMDEIFRDSLDRFSNVCNGCYKAIYTIALAKAEELGIASIVTGLSRGQFFETRLVPGMFESDRFDPDAIDEMVKEARHVYHTTPDAVSEHMDVEFLADETIFDRISFIDFYRYIDVELSELYRSLDESGTWQRPPDSGRSTNCLINSAGIFVHKIEQGHHSYAAPYSWDVRLGHKTRAEAMFELDDPMDEAELAAITKMLAEVGYEPRTPEMLTLWIESSGDLDLDELRSELAEGLPAHAVPHAIELVDSIPLTANGKVDMAALPAPALRRISASSGDGRAAETETEIQIASTWATVLGLASVSATEDFFALGGTSLHALEMIVRVSDHFDLVVPESLAFTKRTVAELAEHVDDSLKNALDDTLGSGADRESARDALEIRALDAALRLPLSAGEESMLYEWHKDPSDLRYNVARLYRLPAGLDVERFNDAVRLAVANQPTLSMSYGPLRQKLDVSSALWIGHSSSDIAPLHGMAQHINATPFDLVNGPLVTVHHLTSEHVDDRDQHAVLIRTHHIVSDAGSLDVLWNQIDLAYSGEDLPDLGATYAAHSVWQRGRVADPAEVWSPAETPAELLLRGGGAEPDGYVHHVSSISHTELRNAPGTTPFATALTALAGAMRPYHDGDQLELTITSSVRDHPAIADVVGYFLNPLPLLLDVSSESSMYALSASVSASLAQGLEHRAVPFGAIVRSARERNIPGPTGRIMLAVEDLAAASLDGVPVEHQILSSGTAVNDLTFFVQIRGERVELGCEYRGSTIGRDSAERLLERFGAALSSLVDTPRHSVDTLAARPVPLSGPEIEDLGLLVPDLIEHHVADRPDVSAVRSGSASLTYSELDTKARGLAARLRAVGVGPGDRVAVVLPRSVDTVAAIHATWMLGASYVPIDVSQPPTRVTELISAADVSAAISSGDGHAGLTEVTTIHVDSEDAAVLPLARRHAADASSEAYLIFTSGSTGEPKGVPISHANLRASLAARRQWYQDPVERYLLVSSAGFDSSVAGLFWTLADGGELVIPTESEVHDIDALSSLIAVAAVTHTLMVPSLYGALLQRANGPNGPSGQLESLRTVIVAGESCPPALVGAHVQLAAAVDLVNEYGPTEATVWSTAHRCTSADAEAAVVPIGSPIPGTAVEVVDTEGNPQPIDAAGELWVSGPGVADGYLNDGESPAFLSGRRPGPVYRTGDLAVRRTDGTIEFLGRIDDQLSVGGVRIEPTEVERAIASLPSVLTCLVGLRDSQLVSWVVVDASSDSELTDSQVGHNLRASARALLPATHVPSRVVVVGELPRNANGKLDRNRIDELRMPSSVTTDAARVSSFGDPLTAEIIAIFTAAFEGAALDGAEFAADTDFFDAGGDSLRAVAVVSMLENRFGRRVAIGELIDAPTPALLAARLVDAPNAPTAVDRSADVADGLGAADDAEARVRGASDGLGAADDAEVRVRGASDGSGAVDDAKVRVRGASDGSGAADDAEVRVRGASDGLVEWLRSSGSQTPLIVLPPGGGNLLRYAPLVKALASDTPVVGVRLPGADARSEIVDSIPAQAAAMLDALDGALPNGPYRLLGWSTGGLLAWEIARILQARGDEVELVALIDTVMAGLRVDDTGTITEKYRNMLSNEGAKAVAFEGVSRLWERGSHAIARRRYRKAREGGASPTMEDAERQLGPVIRRAALNYSPGPLDLPVVYVGASESDDAVTLDPWATLQQDAGKPFTNVIVDGVHFLPEDRCILGKNQVANLVRQLSTVSGLIF